MNDINCIQPKALGRKKEIIRESLFLLAIVAAFYAVEIARLFGPLFEFAYYGMLTDLFVYVLKGIFYIAITAVGYSYGAKKFNLYDERPKEKLSLSRISIIYAIVVVMVLVLSAVLGFKVKLAVDLGENITGPTLFSNIGYIGSNIARMSVIILALRYAQDILDKLFESKWTSKYPIAGLFTMVFFGLFCLFLDGISAVNIILLVSHILYSQIYLISKKTFGTTFVSAFLIQLL